MTTHRAQISQTTSHSRLKEAGFRIDILTEKNCGYVVFVTAVTPENLTNDNSNINTPPPSSGKTPNTDMSPSVVRQALIFLVPAIGRQIYDCRDDPDRSMLKLATESRVTSFDC